MRHSNSLENKTLSDTYWIVQLVCVKIEAHSSCNHWWNAMRSRCQGSYDLFNHLGNHLLPSYGNICSFRLVLEGKTGKEIPESSRLEFWEKFLANNFALSVAEDNTSTPLNRRGIADLPLFWICQKSWEPSFWEEVDSFVLVTHPSFAASRTLLQ